MNDEIIACQCFAVCSAVGVEPGPWCRYHTSDLPPPGMARFDPKEEWCPPGVQANVLMLGYMLSRAQGDDERPRQALEQVRKWARELRREHSSYNPAQSDES